MRYTSAHASVRYLAIVTTLLALLPASGRPAAAQQITAAGQPAQLDIRVAGDESIRVTLKPVSFKDEFPNHPALAERKYPPPVAERA